MVPVSAPSIEFFSGLPVAVDPERIERELSRLWKDEPGVESAVTRACLSNLIFYLPDRAAREQAARMLPGVARRYPSRMLLLAPGVSTAGDGPGGGGGGLRASISAVCHLPSPGAPPVCCEQIALEAKEGSLELFPGAVLPLLLPDVPAILVVLGPGGEPLFEELHGVVDRVLFDSRELPIGELERIRRAFSREPPLEADDLAWRDTGGLRRAISDLFEDRRVLPLLDALSSIEVEHAERGAAEAALVSGWIASRLGFTKGEAVREAGPARTFLKGERRLRAAIRPGPGSVSPAGGGPAVGPGQIISVTLGFGAESLRIFRGTEPRVLGIENRTRERCAIPRRLALRPESEADLLGTALERSTNAAVLREALELALLWEPRASGVRG